jgi:uncharacterized RmlC-like cupin family protein
MQQVEVVRGAGLKKGESTQGILREKAFESKDILFARSKIAGGVKSGWHHHGQRDLFGFVVSGRLRFDHGKGGADSVEVSAGDFFHIPVGLIHRDVNPDQGQAVVVNMLLGEGPAVVNVEEP